MQKIVLVRYLYLCWHNRLLYTFQGQFTRLKASLLTQWLDTLSASAGVSEPTLDCCVVHCKSVFLRNEDRAYLDAFVMFLEPTTGKILVGQIREILAQANTGQILGILVSECKIGGAVEPYRFPSLRPSSYPSHYLQIEVCHKRVIVIMFIKLTLYVIRTSFVLFMLSITAISIIVRSPLLALLFKSAEKLNLRRARSSIQRNQMISSSTCLSYTMRLTCNLSNRNMSIPLFLRPKL